MAIYLNTNSTDFTNTHIFNPSDKALPPVIEMIDEWDDYVLRVKKYINAPKGSHVIIVSGASEAVATCMHWTKSVYGNGTVWGSDYDHSTIKENAHNYDLKYSQYKQMPSDTVAIVITQVNPKTGEIYDMNTFAALYSKIKFANNSAFFRYDTEGTYLLYKPLIFLDASQSITKVPINMEKYNINAVFFSLHKIGGKIGTGLLIINPRKDTPFKPLIAGHQQQAYRGGTYPLEAVLSCNFFNLKDNVRERMNAWTEGYNLLKHYKMNVYTPKAQHLYNTYLINVGKVCPLKIINSLAEMHGIYIGTASACRSEEIELYGRTDAQDDFIRISFKHGSDINANIIKKIVDTYHMVEMEE